MPHSRLTKRIENRSKKQTYFFIGGIIIIIIFLFKFGVPTLEVLTNILSKNKGDNSSFAGKEFLVAPTLDIPTATNSSTLLVKGVAPDNSGQVEVYVNSGLSDTLDLNKTDFDTKVDLRGGDNVVKARYVKDDKKSSFSEDYHVRYVKDAPKLDISTPHDGDKFTKADQQIPIQGTTDPDNTVTVNGFVAIVDSAGNFTYNLNLSEGDNEIKIQAQSPAGNTTSKTLKINYSK